MVSVFRSFLIAAAFLMGVVLMWDPGAGADATRNSATVYVLERLACNDIVFMGTTHKQPAILALITNLLPDLRSRRVTHIAVEISSDQQLLLDRYMQSGSGLDAIGLPAAIDCPDYRRLLSTIQQMEKRFRPRVMALDLPTTQYNTGISRDQWMAHRLADIFSSRIDARVLVVLGSLHVLRKLEWQNPRGPRPAALRTYLTAMQPDLRMHSIVNIVGNQQQGCDFSRTFKPEAAPIAVAVDQRFSGWRLGLTDCIAIAANPPNELIDGIIIY